MKTKTIITALAISLSIGIASQAGAWMGGMGGAYDCDGPMTGRMMHKGWGGPMMGPRADFSLSQDQQQQVKEIEAKYQDELEAKEAAIRGKITEIDKAYADDSTTVAQLNTLRTDLVNLKRDYWQTRQALNREIAGTLGANYYGAGGWGPRFCLMDDDMMDGYGPMMGMRGGGYGRHCRW